MGCAGTAAINARSAAVAVLRLGGGMQCYSRREPTLIDGRLESTHSHDAAKPNLLMPSVEILSVVLLGAIAWFWLDSLGAREAAMKAARAACDAEGLMLLDDTVAISGLKAARDEDGRMRLQRVYDFEYSDTGNNRRKGSVVLLGRRVVLFNVGFRDTHLPDTLH
jgi:hypothetical protein